MSISLAGNLTLADTSTNGLTFNGGIFQQGGNRQIINDIGGGNTVTLAGVATELLVVPGAYHGFDIIVPGAGDAKAKLTGATPPNVNAPTGTPGTTPAAPTGLVQGTKTDEVADEEGKSGAQRMSDEGAMDGVDYVIAQHVDPMKPVGTIAINAGPASGGVDSWHAVIRGKGGHGAHPDKTVDPFYMLSHVILALNAIISRRPSGCTLAARSEPTHFLR